MGRGWLMAEQDYTRQGGATPPALALTALHSLRKMDAPWKNLSALHWLGFPFPIAMVKERS